MEDEWLDSYMEDRLSGGAGWDEDPYDYDYEDACQYDDDPSPYDGNYSEM